MGARSTLRIELSAPLQAVASLVLICGRQGRTGRAKQMTRTLLTAIFLTLLSQTAWVDAKI